MELPNAQDYIVPMRAVQYHGTDEQTEQLLAFFASRNLVSQFFPRGEIRAIDSDCIFVDTTYGYRELRVGDYVTLDVHDTVRLVPQHEFDTNYH